MGRLDRNELNFRCVRWRMFRHWVKQGTSITTIRGWMRNKKNRNIINALVSLEVSDPVVFNKRSERHGTQ